jgi:hypothetical protein
MVGRSVILVGKNGGGSPDKGYNIITSDNSSVHAFLPPNEILDEG